VIKVDSLSRTYGKAVAVDRVSFEIGSTEVVGLLGQNGAGKTTIMKMLAGCLESTAGKITIDGTDISENRQIIQAQIGYLPETLPLYPEMTVLSYLEYAAALKKIPNDIRRESIIYAICQTQIVDVAEKKISTLSRGYRQRLALAGAILKRPRILILDEPTNGLDPSQILQMRALIAQLAKTSTIIISTHILQEVQAMCDRVIIIKQGRLVLDCGLDKLQSSNQISLTVGRKLDNYSCNLDGSGKLTIVAAQEPAGKHFRYTLEINDADSPDDVIPKLVQDLVQKDYRIFSVQPVLRSLETVFQDLSSGKPFEYHHEDYMTSKKQLESANSIERT
jgi:ABC-2 type transport system ATP-binding protein